MKMGIIMKMKQMKKIIMEMILKVISVVMIKIKIKKYQKINKMEKI